jgi:hypothetical protein
MQKIMREGMHEENDRNITSSKKKTIPKLIE